MRQAARSINGHLRVYQRPSALLMIRGNPRSHLRTSASTGQSTLEYILVLAAILVAVIVAANGVIRPGVNQVMIDSKTVITGATTKLTTGVH